MAQTLVSLLVHLVFSTKNRANLITPDIEPESSARTPLLVHSIGKTVMVLLPSANQMWSHSKVYRITG
jgi:hypothetical protein